MIVNLVLCYWFCCAAAAAAGGGVVVVVVVHVGLVTVIVLLILDIIDMFVGLMTIMGIYSPVHYNDVPFVILKLYVSTHLLLENKTI